MFAAGGQEEIGYQYRREVTSACGKSSTGREWQSARSGCEGGSSTIDDPTKNGRAPRLKRSPPVLEPARLAVRAAQGNLKSKNRADGMRASKLDQ